MIKNIWCKQIKKGQFRTPWKMAHTMDKNSQRYKKNTEQITTLNNILLLSFFNLFLNKKGVIQEMSVTVLVTV